MKEKEGMREERIMRKHKERKERRRVYMITHSPTGHYKGVCITPNKGMYTSYISSGDLGSCLSYSPCCTAVNVARITHNTTSFVFKGSI